MKGIGLLGLMIFSMAGSCVPSRGTKQTDVQFKWTIAGCLPAQTDGVPSPGLAGPVAGVSNDRLIIGGGSNFPHGLPWDGGDKVYYDEVYLFQNKGDSIVAVQQDLHLPYRVAYSANGVSTKGLVVAGGENEQGALDKVLLINWDANKKALDIVSLPTLPEPLTAGALATIGNNVYFAGGQNASSVSDKLYHLDLDSVDKGWDTLVDLPQPVTHAVLYARSEGADTSLYLVGGRKRNPDSTSTLYDQLYQLHLGEKQWVPKAPLPFALSAHTGLVWGDSSLLVLSGDQGAAFHETEVLSMDIARATDSVEKQRLIERKKNLQDTHPGFEGKVLAYDIHTGRWTELAPIPFPGQVTTTALQWGDAIVIPCGEVRAGVRTPDIIMGKPF